MTMTNHALYHYDDRCDCNDHDDRILLYRNSMDALFLLRDLCQRAIRRHRCDDAASAITLLHLKRYDIREYVTLRDTITATASSHRITDICPLSEQLRRRSIGDFCYVYRSSSSFAHNLRQISYSCSSSLSIRAFLSKACKIGALNTWWVRCALDYSMINGGAILEVPRYIGFYLTSMDDDFKVSSVAHCATNGCVFRDNATAPPTMTCPWHAWTFALNVCVCAMISLYASPSVRRFVSERFIIANDRRGRLISCGAYCANVRWCVSGRYGDTKYRDNDSMALLVFGVDELYVLPLETAAVAAVASKSVRGVPYRSIVSCDLIDDGEKILLIDDCDTAADATTTTTISIIVADDATTTSSSRRRRCRSCNDRRNVAYGYNLTEVLYDTISFLLRFKSH